MAGKTGKNTKNWRAVASLVPYKILRIPQVKATDDFTIQTSVIVNGTEPDVCTRSFFSCNGRARRATCYQRASTGNITWIADTSHGDMLIDKTKTPPHILTYTCTADTMQAQVQNGRSVSLATAPAPKVNLKTESGLDMSCLLIGVFFELEDYTAYYMDGTLYFNYLIIQTDSRTISIGQDPSGRFYDKNTGVRIQELDTRETVFVYEAD